MGAPRGNKNGETAWFESTGEEKSIKKYLRLTESLDKQVAALLTGDETFSDFARAAIEREIIRRRSCE